MVKRAQTKRKVPAERKTAATTPDLKKENADLRREVDRLEQQQTATADVLKVISRSTFDLQMVLDTLVESAGILCKADQVVIHRPQGRVYRMAAGWGLQTRQREFVKTYQFKPDRGTIAGRVLLELKAVHVHDINTDPDFPVVRDRMQKGGAKIGTVLGVPLLREGAPTGVFVLTRLQVKPFTDKQIELVQTFADQAVIAIENVRLFDEVQARSKDLADALEQQTATSEVLSVISSSPGELEPVFEKMLENAIRVCNAKYGNMLL